MRSLCCEHPCPLRRFAPALPKGEPFGYTSTTFYHTFPLATRLNGRKTAKTGRKVEKMRGNHSAATPQSHKTLGKKTPESPKIPLQLGCSVTQIRHFFKRTFFNLPLIFENNVKKATVWLHERLAEAEKPLPLGEVSPEVTERARMLTVIQGRSDSIALTKSLLIAAWAVLSCRACPLRRSRASSPKGRAFRRRGKALRNI